MKRLSILILIFMTFDSMFACTRSNGINTDPYTDTQTFVLKKSESKSVGSFKIKMLGVGHTIERSGHRYYANLEITENGAVTKPTLYIADTIPLGEKFLQLIAISETADPKLSDPFAATSCTLIVKTENPQKVISDVSTPTPELIAVNPKIKPTLTNVKYAKIRLGYGKKSAVVDLDDTSDVTLGGETNHRYTLLFTAVKDNKIYFLFHVRSGPALSNPMGPCGGDSPETLVWLQTTPDLMVEKAQSEVFASCAFNGGRYQDGKTERTATTLRIVFEQQRQKTEIKYNNASAENGFEVKPL